MGLDIGRLLGATEMMVRSCVPRQSRLQALDALDGLGWVLEHQPDEGRRHLAHTYLQAIAREERPLVVAQTWSEVEAVNTAVRAALGEAGRLGPSTQMVSYRAVDLTAAEKQDAASYGRSANVLFLRTYGRYQRGDICPVIRATSKGITLLKNGRRSTLAFRYADRLTVIQERPLELAPGDRLQLKMNGRSLDGQPLANGELATIRDVRSDGGIVIESDRGQRKVLGAGQRVFNYGYATTSYGSQGKTVDTVLFSDSGSRLATNQKQFYVTISRGRRRALVFTPDKAALRRAVSAEGHRPLAVEAAKAGTPLRQGVPVADWRRRIVEEGPISPAIPKGAGIRP